MMQAEIVFMDESGDLGLEFSKPRTSKNFIIAFLFCSNQKVADKIVKKIFHTLSKNQKSGHSGTLHCNKERLEVRYKTLELIKKHKQEFLIAFIRINKKKIKKKKDQNSLYNEACCKLLNDISIKCNFIKRYKFIASKRGLNKACDIEFKKKIEAEALKNKVSLQVFIKTPSENKGLQLVDFIAWAVFQKYENKKNEFYEIIRDMIFMEVDF
jgi:hypothetical protein